MTLTSTPSYLWTETVSAISLLECDFTKRATALQTLLQKRAILAFDPLLQLDRIVVQPGFASQKLLPELALPPGSNQPLDRTGCLASSFFTENESFFLIVAYLCKIFDSLCFASTSRSCRGTIEMKVECPSKGQITSVC